MLPGDSSDRLVADGESLRVAGGVDGVADERGQPFRWTAGEGHGGSFGVLGHHPRVAPAQRREGRALGEVAARGARQPAQALEAGGLGPSGEGGGQPDATPQVELPGGSEPASQGYGLGRRWRWTTCSVWKYAWSNP